VIGISWTVIILVMSVMAGAVGRVFMGEISDSATVFIQMTRRIFPPVISGVLLSAILAASMSTADSQLLASASAFASDVYKPLIRKNKTSDKEMLWTGRVVVIAIAVVALLIAANPGAGSIMALVSNAWGVFGAAFGPAILLSLFWKRFNFAGALAGIIVGAAADILWLIFYTASTGIYEILPGFVFGMLAAMVVSLITKEPSAEVEALYDSGVAYRDQA
jgi:sodium/proline symporter